MAAAGYISTKLTGLATDELERQNALLSACGIELTVSGIAAAEVLTAMQADKKSAGGRPRWVLLEELGTASAGHSVDDTLVREALVAIGI